MTPKEKAKELIGRFSKIPNVLLHIAREPIVEAVAKQGALICVDEIVKEIEHYQDKDSIAFRYWKNVRNQIRKYGTP